VSEVTLCAAHSKAHRLGSQGSDCWLLECVYLLTGTPDPFDPAPEYLAAVAEIPGFGGVLG
jgi:hypothetical protein